MRFKLPTKVILLTVTLSLASTSWGFGARSPSSASDGASAVGAIQSARWEGKASDARDWTVHTYNEVAKVAPNLLKTTPADFKEFCPGFTSLSESEKKNFWVHLLSAMAQYESNFKPSLQYKEAFKDAKGKNVISRGLLQLSIESGNGYGCGFKNENELHDPYKNLSCGLRILNKWVGNDKRIAGSVGGAWKGGARYWSVLRTASKVSSIKSWTKDFCETKL